MPDLDAELVAQIPALRRYARALAGDAADADDLVQDCLARACERLRLWRRGSDLRAWLFTILHNLYLNERRDGRQRAGHLSLEELEVPGEGERDTESLVRLRDLQAALLTLPAEQRATLLLVGLEGLRYRDVARVLGVPLGTVMSRLHRAREGLRARLEGGPSPRLRRVK